jgi:hypothetical protein
VYGLLDETSDAEVAGAPLHSSGSVVNSSG